jgi:hypothetical protein
MRKRRDKTHNDEDRTAFPVGFLPLSLSLLPILYILSIHV